MYGEYEEDFKFLSFDEEVNKQVSMEMLDGVIHRMLGMVSVKERNDIITIEGVSVERLFYDIRSYFSTSKVASNLFRTAKGNKVTLHSFFLIDFEYIIRILANLPKTRLGKRTYIKIKEELKLNTWIGRLEKDLPSIFNLEKLNEIKYGLLKHQKEFIDYYDKIIPRYGLKGLLLAAEPGLGKTISSIAVACCYEAENVIVISPKNAVFRVWESTLKNDMTVPQTVWVQASGQPMPSPNNNRWFVFHYESLDKAIELANMIKDRKTTVILDEAHHMNEMKSLRTERFVSMCNSLPKAIIVELSGTPMKALGYEAIPLIKAIDPKFNDECMVSFRKMFGKDALKATDILANRLGIVMYKVSKEETDVKPLKEHYINVKVANEDRFLLSTIRETMVEFITERTNYYKSRFPAYERTYENCLKEFEEAAFKNKPFSPEYEKYKRFVKIIREKKYIRETFADYTVYCTKYEKQVIEPALRPERRKDFRDAKSVVKYVELKIRGEALGTVLSKARMECNKAIVDAFDFTEIIDNAEKKTLIFTSYVDVVKATDAKLSDQGYKPICVYADTNSNLPQLVSKFGSDENINPLIATYQSLSTAVPLTMANVVILLNQPFRIHEKEQAMARANRLGQDKQVHVYNILLDTGGEPNISTRSLDIMEWSRQQVNAIMGFENDIDVGIESFDEMIEDVKEEVSVESKSLVNTHTTSSFEEDGTVKVWDISKIWELTANYPVKNMAVDYVYDTIKDDVAKFKEEDYIKVEKADLSYPIIFNNKMGVIDGIHRVYKANKQGLKTIDVKHLLIMPKPDYVFNCVEEWEAATQHRVSTESIMSDLAIKSEVNPNDVTKKIKEFEDDCGFKFPKELVEYFNNYSGGNRFTGASDGGFEEFCKEALDIDGSKRVWNEHAGNDKEVEVDAEHGVKEVYFDNGWIPLFTNGDDVLICMDLNPAPGGKKGQLIGVPVHHGYREKLVCNWKYDVFQPRLNPLSKKLDYLEKILKTKTPKELVEFYDKTLPNLSNGRVVEGKKKLNLHWSDTPYGDGSTGIFLEKFKVKCAVLALVGENEPLYSVCYVFNTEGYQDGEIHLFSHYKHLGKVSDTLKDFLTKDVVGVMYLLLGIDPNDGAKTNKVKKKGFFSKLFKRK